MAEHTHERLSELFLKASELPQEQRAEFLECECGSNLQLLREIEFLLESDPSQSPLDEGLAGLEGFRSESRPFQLPTIEGENGEPIFGDYRILKELGRGGMGVVYEAEQLSLHRRVALKTLPGLLALSPDSVSKFRREAEAGGRLTHPCIVAVHAVGEHQGTHYIVQELVPGGHSLADSLARMQRQTELSEQHPRQCSELMVRIAEALQEAHDHGVIHRDIKPGNILLAQDGSPKVTDFGLAKVEDALSISRSGDFAGTPFYMSPEQAAGTTVGHHSDLFSLGATFYELLTLHRPFEGDSVHAILRSIAQRDPLPPHRARSLVPRELSAICLKALEKRPARRYSSMAAFAEDLRAWMEHRPIEARPPGIPQRLSKWLLRHPVLSVSSMVALVALTLITMLLFDTREQRDRALQAEEQAQERLVEIGQLSDVLIVRDLVFEAAELWPRLPSQSKAYADWLERADDLLTHLPLHQRTLSRVQKQALDQQRRAGLLSLGAGEPDHSVLDIELRWQITKLRELVQSLDDLKPLKDDVASRLQFSATLEARSLLDHAEDWEDAITDILVSDTYGGLEIDPILGLVPLGPDPDSGLWEFWHVGSGSCPIRDADTEELLLHEENGLVLVLLPGGIARMGAQKDDPKEAHFDGWALRNEKPVHEVEIDPFLISKYEMTQAQWQRIAAHNPSYYGPTHGLVGINAPVHPVESVGWTECEKTLWQLNLSLPTEAQWEHAARAGTETPWCGGKEPIDVKEHGNFADEHFQIVFHHREDIENWNDGFVAHAPVNAFRANHFGLHCMLGNVKEWCADFFGSYTDPVSAGTGLRLPAESDRRRITRGGSFNTLAHHGRSSQRLHGPPNRREASLGVRPVRSLQP